VFPVEVRTTEEDASADAELVLAIALEVSEFGVEVVCLNGADPDVFETGMSSPPPTVRAKEVS
jgi:hypothetical protein